MNHPARPSRFFLAALSIGLALPTSGCVTRQARLRALEAGTVPQAQRIEWLGSSDPVLREAVVRSCARSSAGACLNLPNTARLDPDPAVRAAAWETLAKRCTPDDRAFLADEAAAEPLDPAVPGAVGRCPSADATYALVQRGAGEAPARPALGGGEGAELAALEVLLDLPPPRAATVARAQALRAQLARRRAAEEAERRQRAFNTRHRELLAAAAWSDAVEATRRAQAEGVDTADAQAAFRSAVGGERAAVAALVDAGRLEEARPRLEALRRAGEAPEALLVAFREKEAAAALAASDAAFAARDYEGALSWLEQAAAAEAAPEAVASRAPRIQAARWAKLAPTEPDLERVDAFLADIPEAQRPPAALERRRVLAAAAEREAWVEAVDELDYEAIRAVLDQDVAGAFGLWETYPTPLKMKIFARTAEYRALQKELQRRRKLLARKTWTLEPEGGCLDVSGSDYDSDVPSYDVHRGGFWVCVEPSFSELPIAVRRLRLQQGRILLRASEAEGLRVEACQDRKVRLRFQVTGVSRRETWGDAFEAPRFTVSGLVVEIVDPDDRVLLSRRLR